MSLLNFTLTLAIAVLLPMLALAYLRPILRPVLRSLCSDPTVSPFGAEFWLRSATLLAVSGTALLGLWWGQFCGDPVDAVHRALMLAAVGTFATIAFIARSLWTPVRRVAVPPVRKPAEE